MKKSELKINDIVAVRKTNRHNSTVQARIVEMDVYVPRERGYGGRAASKNGIRVEFAEPMIDAYSAWMPAAGRNDRNGKTVTEAVLYNAGQVVALWDAYEADKQAHVDMTRRHAEQADADPTCPGKPFFEGVHHSSRLILMGQTSGDEALE